MFVDPSTVTLRVDQAKRRPRRRREGTGRAPASASYRIRCDAARGVVDIRDPRLFLPGKEAFCRDLVQAAVERHDAFRAEICLTSSRCRLEFEPARYQQNELADRVAAAVMAATLPVDHGPVSSHGAPLPWTSLTAFAADAWEFLKQWPKDHAGLPLASAPDAATSADYPGTSGLLDLALAGGSFMLAISGAVLPGIPGLPFLLLAGHYASRSSPTIRRFLSRQNWYVAMSGQGASSGHLPGLDPKSFLKLLTISALAAAAFLVIHPPLPVVLGLELVSMTFFCFRNAQRENAPEARVAA
jgi:uncharacterized membrane protein YbaN (DUF454 family)